MPAPFCLGADQGSGESNPELAEGGGHLGATGASPGWAISTPPSTGTVRVASLTVERTG
ncbi:MAG: hypothetical protein R2755_08680 [Acidimicrobiales bacterium]